MFDSPFTQFIASLNSNSIWVGVKIFYLAAFLIYALFALIIFTQVNQMKKNIALGLEFMIQPIILIHLGLAVLALVLALVLL